MPGAEVVSTATITRASSVIKVVMPLRAESLNFLHGMHWAKRAALTKMHRTYAWAAMREADTAPRLLGPVVVTLTRVAPRELDTDNLTGGLKAIRDGIADWLGVPDNDPRVIWRYDQRKGEPKKYAVEVEVRPA